MNFICRYRRNHSYILILFFPSFLSFSCILIGKSPDRIRKNIFENKLNPVQVSCFVFKSFYYSGHVIQKKEVDKYNLVPKRIGEALEENFRIRECDAREDLPKNRIEIETEAHFDIDCAVNKGCSEWVSFYTGSFAIIPLFGDSTGYVQFTIISSGKTVASFEYRPTLLLMAWLPLLPLIWINLFGGSYENHFATSNAKAVTELKAELKELGIHVVPLQH